MPDDDDEHIVLKFQPGRKPRATAADKRPAGPQTDPEDFIAGGGVLLALIFAVAMVSGWIAFDRYTIGLVACLAALAVGAKLVKARRSKASVTGPPRQRR